MSNITAPLVKDDAKALAIHTLDAMRSGSRADFDEVCHSEFFNHEQFDEPPAARGRGPSTAYATALWLRDAFAELTWEVHSMVAEDDLVVVHCTMSGRHVNPFVAYAQDGSVDEVFPPDRGALRHYADSLAADRRRQGHRALGQPRRPGDGQAARLGAAHSALPRPHGAGQAPRPARSGHFTGVSSITGICRCEARLRYCSQPG